MAEERKRGLGRGLSALMADVQPAAGSAPPKAERTVPIEMIRANADQPRRRFDPEKLADLRDSIREKGVLQPLLVRPVEGDVFEIVAGERRWRAAQEVGLHELPVVVRDYDDTEVLEVAIIENIQRADLDPMEEATGYRQLMEKFGHTQEKLGEVLGKSRSHIANLMRLLQLPDDVQDLVAQGKLSAGHARALITSDDASGIAKEVVKKDLSVRQTEALMKRRKAGPKPKAEGLPSIHDSDTAALAADLSAALGFKVLIQHKNSGYGQVLIRYGDLDELDTLCAKLSRAR